MSYKLHGHQGKWVLKKPGHLVLHGTPMSIEYVPGDSEAPFHVKDQRGCVTRLCCLVHAKMCGEEKLAELREMGLF